MLTTVIEKGDSGAWVTFNDTVLGVIVAGSDVLPWAYMLPMEGILDNMRTSLNCEVSLPQAGDFQASETSARAQQNFGVGVSEASPVSAEDAFRPLPTVQSPDPEDSAINSVDGTPSILRRVVSSVPTSPPIDNTGPLKMLHVNPGTTQTSTQGLGNLVIPETATQHRGTSDYIALERGKITTDPERPAEKYTDYGSRLRRTPNGLEAPNWRNLGTALWCQLRNNAYEEDDSSPRPTWYEEAIQPLQELDERYWSSSAFGNESQNRLS